MKSKAYLKKLAVEYVDGKIFTSRQCSSDFEVGYAFWLFTSAKIPAKTLKTIDLLWGYYSDAKGPWMNGKVPFLHIAGFLSKSDTKIFDKYVKEYSELKKGWLGEGIQNQAPL